MDAEIIVVNDSKNFIPTLPATVRNLILLNNPKSGVASARNLGASHARANLLIFMDDDFIVSNDALTEAIRLDSQFPNQLHLFNWSYPPDLLAEAEKCQFGRYLIFFGFTTLKGWMGASWNEQQEVFELKDGASYFLPIRKKVFDALNGYNEAFPHAGAEDYDFVQRAKKIGLKFFLNKKFTIFHNEKDRLDLQNWLLRKRRNGETLRVAVDEGHHELTLSYPQPKKNLLKVLSKSKVLVFILIRSIPNLKWLDKVYFRMVNILLAIYLFDGYMKKLPGDR